MYTHNTHTAITTIMTCIAYNVYVGWVRLIVIISLESEEDCSHYNKLTRWIPSKMIISKSDPIIEIF